eukprot:364639-Chlamydomonas_euryale.AAC.16
MNPKRELMNGTCVLRCKIYYPNYSNPRCLIKLRMLPLGSVNLASSGGSTGLRETLTELDNFVAGEACAIEPVRQPCALGYELYREVQQDDLLCQVCALDVSVMGAGHLEFWSAPKMPLGTWSADHLENILL